MNVRVKFVKNFQKLLMFNAIFYIFQKKPGLYCFSRWPGTFHSIMTLGSGLNTFSIFSWGSNVTMYGPGVIHTQFFSYNLALFEDFQPLLSGQFLIQNIQMGPALVQTVFNIAGFGDRVRSYFPTFNILC